MAIIHKVGLGLRGSSPSACVDSHAHLWCRRAHTRTHDGNLPVQFRGRTNWACWYIQECAYLCDASVRMTTTSTCVRCSFEGNKNNQHAVHNMLLIVKILTHLRTQVYAARFSAGQVLDSAHAFHRGRRVRVCGAAARHSHGRVFPGGERSQNNSSAETETARQGRLNLVVL